MLRITTAALLAVLLGSVAHAQGTAASDAAPDAAAAAGAGVQAAGATAAGDEDDDDDDDEGGATTAAAGGLTVQHHDYGPSGIMVRTNRADLEPLTLAAGQPVAQQEYDLQSGGYYRINIVADGSQELALSGGDFFRSVWVNEIIVNDIEIRPMGVHSIEFDSAGEAEMSFIAIVPGRYTLSIPGSRGETQQAVFNIR